jgi:hypothetical protein
MTVAGVPSLVTAEASGSVSPVPVARIAGGDWCVLSMAAQTASVAGSAMSTIPIVAMARKRLFMRQHHTKQIDSGLKHQSPHYGSVMTGAFFVLAR